MNMRSMETGGGKPDETYEVSRLLVGVDLGQSSDFSAVAVVRQQIATKTAETRKGGWWSEARLPTDRRRYNIQHLARWPLSTPYTIVAADLADLVQTLREEARWIGSPSADPPHAGSVTIAYDQTGLGAPVGDVLRSAGVQARGIVIGSGQADTTTRTGGVGVPKEHLLTHLLVLLEQRRLRADRPDLPDLDTLMAEMAAYTRRQTHAGGQTYSTSGQAHADLLMALAIASYAGRLADQSEQQRAARRRIAEAWRR
jgi:hypothetical protein